MMSNKKKQEAFFSKTVFAEVCLVLILVSTMVHASDSTIVERFGQLSVQGNKIVDKYGRPIALKGMSLYWSQWKGQFYNANTVQWLRDDWKCTVVRAAMAVESGGYLTNPSGEKLKIKAVIDACINLGIYVIIDWHDHYAQRHRSQSITFFKEMATLYGNSPNVIYEIYNEPLGSVSWSDSVKPYADSVVKNIRAIDPDNLILVGSPTWSQDVDIAANNPLAYNNIAYSLHFYAATHKQSLRNKATTALNKGVALFVSEFGTTEASGTGVIDSTETETWMQFMNTNSISWCNWSVADLTETSAALKPGASASGGWSNANISTSGLWVRNKIRTANELLFTSVTVPTEIPKNFELRQNYPNPFNPSTNITFQIPKTGIVTLKIFDLLGREVSTLVNEVRQAGIHEMSWDAANISSGIYFYRIQAGNFTETKHMILIK